MSLNASQFSTTILAEALIEAIFSRDADGSLRLIELGADPAYRPSLPLAHPAAFGRIALLERLLPLSAANAKPSTRALGSQPNPSLAFL